MAFNRLSVEVLFYSALAKAEASYSSDGLTKLSQAIKDSSSNAFFTLEKKYLDQSIEKKIKEAKEKGKETLGLNENYLNELLAYLRDDLDFKGFEKGVKKVNSLIDSIFNSREPITKAASLISTDQSNRKLQTHFNHDLLYQKQPDPVIKKLKSNAADIVGLLNESLQKPLITLLIISEDLIESHNDLARQLQSLVQKHKKLILFWEDQQLALSSNVNDSSLLLFSDYQIFLQCLYLYEVSDEAIADHEKDDNVTNIINNSGNNPTIHQGKKEITTTYYTEGGNISVSQNNSEKSID